MEQIDSLLTRRHLAEGTLLQALRADCPAGVLVRSDEELEASLEDALRDHDPRQDLHVFGYGSLMWNPALDAVDQTVASLRGWHRRFCLRLLVGRGTPQAPGAMLALDEGGTCEGMLFRIDATKARAEARLLWRREMLTDSYRARWVPVTAQGATLRALTFVVNRRSGRYIGDQPIETTARLLRTGTGPLGTSRDYFERTSEALARLGIRDAGIARLRNAILRADRADSATT